MEVSDRVISAAVKACDKLLSLSKEDSFKLLKNHKPRDISNIIETSGTLDVGRIEAEAFSYEPNYLNRRYSQ